MRFSLILPTINVGNEMLLFLESLKKQTYKNFELIVIDQNNDNNTINIINEYRNYFEIKYLKSRKKGISLNRNKGLYFIGGDIVGFPDDDCEYEETTLEKVYEFFKNNKNDRIYSCRTLEKDKDYGIDKMLNYSCKITKDNVYDTVKSITFFVNYTLEDIQLFDENLGIGSYFGSSEEIDYVLELLHKGYSGYYNYEDIIFHPAKKVNYDDLEKAKNYSLGYGALIKKEVLQRKNYSYFMKFLYKLCKSIYELILTKNRKYHFIMLKYRLKGFFKYK